ncbi:MAG: sugar phosphate isomerase/epimerase [Pyrinomonadaceae bacterium]|nr:sugar phosphate isomerase/epimerase [Pyrinomonadaceae bacterium]
MRSEEDEEKISRRDFLQAAGGAAVMAEFPRHTMLPCYTAAASSQEKTPAPLQVCIFSKHLQWLDWEAMAQTAAEIGFDGVDLTLRKGGHILPERAAQDLPKVAEIIRKAGLTLPTITTGIVDVRTPHAESMLRAIGNVGIPCYRWGGFRYDDTKSIPERLAEIKQEAAKLAEMNQKYKVCAMYHTHSGSEVGASIWDLWLVLKDLNASWVGVNFDIAHATIEGGLGGWINSTRLISPWMRGIAIKDFKWGQNAKGVWVPQWCPLGEGMVNFKRFFSMLRDAKFSGPVQLHCEYPLGGAESGAKILTIDKSKVVAAIRKDLLMLRGWLHDYL